MKKIYLAAFALLSLIGSVDRLKAAEHNVRMTVGPNVGFSTIDAYYGRVAVGSRVIDANGTARLRYDDHHLPVAFDQVYVVTNLITKESTNCSAPASIRNVDVLVGRANGRIHCRVKAS